MDDAYTIAISAVLSFVVTYLVMPIFISFMKAAGITGRDVMKKDHPIVADMGGPGVLCGLLAGLFFYIGMKVFALGGLPALEQLLASISTILIISLIGIFDTLTSLMKQREGNGIFEKMKRKGIPAWLYFLIPLPAAVPLMAVNAGTSSMEMPLIGHVNFGILYPLVLVPFAVLTTSNATNFLAGFNGLEAGMGAVLHTSLGIYALINGRTAAAVLALSFAAGLVAFFRYNWYPANVYPGDLNYTIGAVCTCVAIIGDMERYAILCFTPWVVEAFLKLRSRFKAENYGALQSDGTVTPMQGQVYSLTHLVMKIRRTTEKGVSMTLMGLEVLICMTSFLLLWLRVV